MKKILCAVIGLGLFGLAANAQIVVDDNFNRADGSLVGTAPTPGPGGVWVNHSGTLGDLLISSGQAVVQHGVPSEDAHTSFTAQTVGVITAVFDIIVNDDSVIGGSDFEYFAHFSDGGTFNFYSRVDVVAPNSTGDYTLGIATTSSTAEATLPTDFSFGNTVNVTLSFDWATGLSSLKVGATTITSSTPAPGITINSFNLRQSDSSNNETVYVDNLVVTSVVPEPTSFALGGFGLLTLLLARRRS